MRRSTLVRCALLVVATSGCDKFNALVDRFRGQEEPVPPPPVAVTPGDTAVGAAPVSRAPAPRASAAPRAPRISEPARPTQDEPFFSSDTGTVTPGMSESDVYEVWGAPVSVRRAGTWTYLFFRNGCEYTCGTYDVVFLQNGVVVDAVVRWWGHIYGGDSSSRADVVPMPTRPGDAPSDQ